MKFAFLVMYELRAINHTIDNIKKYVIEKYNADVFIVCQNQFEDDEQRLALFDKNVKIKKMYKKKDPREYYGRNIKICNEFGKFNKGNLQLYINEKEMLNHLENYIDDYDYFITFRVDSHILFPFPDEKLFTQIPPSIYTFDAKYAWWGGYSLCVFIHKNYIKTYLNRTYDIIKNDVKISNTDNQEHFTNACMKLGGINLSFIKNMNIFYTADSLNAYTTAATIKMHKKYNVICKYIEQCDESHANLDLWNNGYTWNVVNNHIMLVKPNVGYKWYEVDNEFMLINTNCMKVLLCIKIPKINYMNFLKKFINIGLVFIIFLITIKFISCSLQK